MSSQNESQQALVDAAETVLREAFRVQSLPVAERMARLKDDKDEALAMLHGHPDYPYFECGSRGIKAFRLLIDYLIGMNSQVLIGATRDTVRAALTYVYLDRFVKNQVPINWNTLQSVYAKTSKHLVGKQSVRRHAYPCALWSNDGPDQVDVGPVCFRRAATFLEEEKMYSPENGFSSVVEEAHDFARQAGWVATVDINSIDEATGAIRAKRTIDAGINILQLFIGAERTRRCRRAEAFGVPARYASYCSDEDGLLCPTLTVGGHDDLVWENWWESYEEMYAPFFLMAGEALVAIQHASPSWGLQERFLGSLSWFGDGARDQHLAARLTKYVFSWERLVVTRSAERSYGNGLSDLLAERLAQLCGYCRMDPKTSKAWVRRAYDLRSRLAQGTVSPWSSDELQKVLHRAERISEAALFGSLMHYAKLHHGAGTDAELERSFSS